MNIIRKRLKSNRGGLYRSNKKHQLELVFFVVTLPRRKKSGQAGNSSSQYTKRKSSTQGGAFSFSEPSRDRGKTLMALVREIYQALISVP
jgi:hypothetical protein